MRKIRIGIDVGGTFTDAVAIDNETGEIIAREKLPTTHASGEGVAEGIITVLQNLLNRNRIAPEEVVFIAHGTTQATNALLEGDVATAGILAMGCGLEAARVKQISNTGPISLARGKELKTLHAFVKTADAAAARQEISSAIEKLKEAGAEVIVATEPYSVDDPDNEQFVMELAREKGLYATGGHEVSKLYGLRVRTRTAVINGSLIPKMMETAVMNVDEVRRRPILTMLSGLAAGVAGVLMYERLSDGIFLESGGTSTDISVVKDGRVMVRYGEVGGHKTYLSSLDVRTLGVAGGSMIRVENGKITDVGPRSAHIAGLAYEVFSEKPERPELKLIAPCSEDDEVYAVVEGADGKRVSLTLAGAANLTGSVPAGDYAEGDRESARIAWQALGNAIGCTAEEAAKTAMDLAARKIGKLVSSLIKEYELSPSILCLAGGGGSAGVIVPYLGNSLNLRWKIVKNAPIISTIGVAMAMVREVVERTVVNPTEEDIRSIRHTAMEQVLQAGAREATVEISIEIDKKTSTLRAVAMGATELRKSERIANAPDADELRSIAARSMEFPEESVTGVATAGKWHIFDGPYTEKLFSLFPVQKHKVRVLDRNGIICLRREGLGAVVTSRDNLRENLKLLLEDTTEFGTTGGQLPGLFAYYGEKQLDLSGLASPEQVFAVLEIELADVPDNETIVILAVR